VVLSADREAMMSWATGFVKTKDYGIDGWTYTIFDQGGGSAELVSGTWNSKRNMIDYLVYETFDLGHSKLAKLYSTSSPISCVTEIRGLLERHAEKIAPQEVKERRSMLILLGGPATKLAFNIKHKKDVNHDYNARAVDVTAISVKEMQSYYNKIVEIHKTDQRRARYEIDRRMVDTDEYERVMSGAILLMLISTRLGYPKVTVTASSTRYGFGFLAARGIIQNKEGMG
jgi:exopolyphosphatase/pppGpp-phosphohydrolase